MEFNPLGCSLLDNDHTQDQVQGAPHSVHAAGGCRVKMHSSSMTWMMFPCCIHVSSTFPSQPTLCQAQRWIRFTPIIKFLVLRHCAQPPPPFAEVTLFPCHVYHRLNLHSVPFFPTHPFAQLHLTEHPFFQLAISLPTQLRLRRGTRLFP